MPVIIEILFLSLIGAGLASAVFDSDDEGDEPQNPDDNSEIETTEEDKDIVDDDPTVDKVDPIVEEELVGDTGATLTFDEETNVLSIDVGDDETGTIAVVHTEESFANSRSYRTDHELYVYLVPEGMDFPPTTADVLAANPELDAYMIVEDVNLNWKDYVENMGAIELGYLDLGGESHFSEDGERPSSIYNDINYNVIVDANKDFASYRISTDAGVGIQEAPEQIEFGETIVPLTEAQIGRVTIVGEDGETTTDTHEFWTRVYGTEGDDTITVEPSSPSLNIFGGDGNDSIDAGTSSSHIRGGEGDDRIIVGDTYSGHAEGGAGDDTLVLGEGSGNGEWTGGAGADTFILNPNDDGQTSFYHITDFVRGTDQIVLELGDNFDENWALEFIPRDGGTSTTLRMPFPDLADDPEHNDFYIRFYRTANLTADDVSIVRAA